MVKLTQKQEAFVRGLISGLSQRQAYKQAYDVKKMKDYSIDVAASRVFSNAKVRLRYRELLKEFSNLALWTREQSFNEHEWLKNQAKEDIKENGVRQANSNAYLGALAKMDELAIGEIKYDLEEQLLRAKVEEIQAKIKAEEDDENDFDGFEFVREVTDET